MIVIPDPVHEYFGLLAMRGIIGIGSRSKKPCANNDYSNALTTRSGNPTTFKPPTTRLRRSRTRMWSCTDWVSGDCCKLDYLRPSISNESGSEAWTTSGFCTSQAPLSFGSDPSLTPYQIGRIAESRLVSSAPDCACVNLLLALGYALTSTTSAGHTKRVPKVS